jgi:hypothetical protein
MQRIVLLSAVLVSVTTSAVCADEQADLKAIVDKAIKAGGGEANLAKYKAETFKAKGKFYGMGEGLDYTGEWAVQPPVSMRVRIDGEAGGMKFSFVNVVHGDKVWKKFGDATMAVEDKEEVAEAKEQTYVAWVTKLLPLRKETGFELAALGEVKVNDKPAIGVRVSRKGRRDVNLFFDKDKGLLVKSETVVKDLMAGGKEVTQETLYADYKEVSGVQVPMKLVINRDGKKYVESELTEVELKEKLDDSVFDKP